MDKMSAYRELIRENISYEILLQDNPYDRERLDGFVELRSTFWGRKQPTCTAPPSTVSTDSSVLGITAGLGAFPSWTVSISAM